MILIPGAELPVQLHLSPESADMTPLAMPNSFANMKKVRFVEDNTTKPASQLWTSDYVDGGSAWVDFVDLIRPVVSPRRYPERQWWHVLTPALDARILVVRTVGDYYEVADRFARANAGLILSTRRLSLACDALRVEEPAVTELQKLGIFYDVSCTAWFRWAFTSTACVREPLVLRTDEIQRSDLRTDMAILGSATSITARTAMMRASERVWR